MASPVPPSQVNSGAQEAQAAQVSSASAGSNEPRSVDSSSWEFSSISSCCSVLDACSCGCFSAVKNAVVRFFSWCAEGLTDFYNWLSSNEMPVGEEQVQEESSVLQPVGRHEQFEAAGQAAMQVLPMMLQAVMESAGPGKISREDFLKEWGSKKVPTKPKETAKQQKKTEYEQCCNKWVNDIGQLPDMLGFKMLTAFQAHYAATQLSFPSTDQFEAWLRERPADPQIIAVIRNYQEPTAQPLVAPESQASPNDEGLYD